eukprot:Skav226387  [mRNA]  locus=scaffold1631:26937:29999:+ [translate_table: standard]
MSLGRPIGLGSISLADGRHPEADVVAVEGSVGIGNGTAGLQGTVRQILRTEAVQTHLRWIQKLELTNCFVAPEVWDYQYICSLAPGRQEPTWVVHHIDNISVQQYAEAGLSRVQGGIDLISKILRLSPRQGTSTALNCGAKLIAQALCRASLPTLAEGFVCFLDFSKRRRDEGMS